MTGDIFFSRSLAKVAMFVINPPASSFKVLLRFLRLAPISMTALSVILSSPFLSMSIKSFAIETFSLWLLWFLVLLFLITGRTGAAIFFLGRLFLAVIGLVFIL